MAGMLRYKMKIIDLMKEFKICLQRNKILFDIFNILQNKTIININNAIY
ncbi:hypothetical protein [Spiroplasma endosymbiont of Polydrusus cervinus]